MDSQLANIGRRIRECREMYHLTQEQLAEKAGFTSKHIGEVERGITQPSVVMLYRLGEIFHCSIDYLATGRAGTGRESERSVPDFLVEYMNHLDDAQYSKFIVYLKAMVDFYS